MQRAISFVSNVPDEEKATKLTAYSEHLKRAKEERIFYNEQCKRCHDLLSTGPAQVMH